MKFKILLLSFFIIQNSFSQFKVENLGPKVNTKNAEVRPTLSADGKFLYFVVEKSVANTGKKSTENVQEVWCSVLNADGTWAQAEKCPEPINNSKKDNAVFWSSLDGSQILIRGTYANGKYQGRGFSFCKKTDKGWSQPEAINIKGYNNLSVDKYDGAFLTNDGKTMLLYLSEEKNSWLNDIYISQQEGENVWSVPQKIISDSISIDDYDEVAPYIAADGVTMYFSSDRPGGHGGYDIWMTKRLDDTWMHWSAPVNVGDSVNSDKWEAYFALDAKAEYAYLATTRNAIGGIDLCKIKLSENQKPKAVTLLQGKVYNADNNELLSNIEVTSETEGSNNPKPIKIENQVFKTILPYGNKYIITAKGEGFETVTEIIDLTNLAPYQEMHKDLFLHPLKKEVVDNLSAKDSANYNQNDKTKTEEQNDVVIKNNEDKTDKSEKQNKAQDKSVKSKNDTKKVKGNKKSKTDVIIDESSIQDLNVEKTKDNTKKVKGKKKKDNEVVAKTEITDQSNGEENADKNKSEKKKSDDKKQKRQKETEKSGLNENSDKNIDQVANNNLEAGEVFTFNNILFDFAKSDLKESSYEELNKVVKLMKENDALKIELSAHTDNIGSDKYNLTLSKSRAKSSKKYLISQGISSKRISSKGYGESKPVASNKTAKGRKQNRRVEIKIVSNK